MRTILRFVSRNLTFMILGAMIAGLFNSYFGSGIQFNIGVCAAASFLMIYPMFINLKMGDVAEARNFKGAVSLSLFLNFIISPALGFFLGKIFFPEQPFMALGLLLISLIPTSGMSATWTERTKGNLKVALSIIAVSLLVVIVLLPIALPLLAGNVLTVTPAFIFLRILMVIIVPLVLGDITRRIIISRKGLDYYKKSKPTFLGLSSLGLLFVLFLIMSLKTNRMLLENPLLVLKGLLPLAIYYIAMFGSSTFLSRKMPYPVSVAVTYGTSVRYLALALGIAVPLLGEGEGSSLVVFIVALAFFVQVPLSSFYSSFRQRKVVIK